MPMHPVHCLRQLHLTLRRLPLQPPQALALWFGAAPSQLSRALAGILAETYLTTSTLVPFELDLADSTTQLKPLNEPWISEDQKQISLGRPPHKNAGGYECQKYNNDCKCENDEWNTFKQQ